MTLLTILWATTTHHTFHLYSSAPLLPKWQFLMKFMGKYPFFYKYSILRASILI